MSNGGGGVMISSSSSSNSANYGFGVGLAGGASTAVAHQGQGVAALLVMIAVLCFMFAYCCWGAPFCRSLCRRHCYCCCRTDELSDSESGGFGSATNGLAEHAMITTPTIILLPHGRTFVVHGRIFTQFQADNTGLDLVEFGESVMRAQRNNAGAGGSTRHHHRQHHHRQLQLQDSQGSIIEMDAETPSKDSIGSLGCFPPPTYESIYGKDEEGDLPPSYSDILLHRFANLPFDLEMQQRDSKEELHSGPRIINNPIAGNFAHRYHHAYSSRSLPRRNPSLISNPLDGYYIDNELASLHRSSIIQRRRSAAADITSRTSSSTSAAGNDEAANDSRTNSDDLAIAVGNILDNHFTSSQSQASHSQNDLMNSRNIARSDSRKSEGSEEPMPSANDIYVRQHSSEESIDIDVNDTVRVHRLNRITSEPTNWNFSDHDLRYDSDEADSRADVGHDASADEEASNNFQALADIRESRV